MAIGVEHSNLSYENLKLNYYFGLWEGYENYADGNLLF